MLTGRWSTMWALARRLAVRLDVAGVWLEPKAAVDAACRVGGLGDDDPAVAATIGGPLCGDAEKVGSQPAPPVLVLGADALITRCAAAPDNAQVCDECVAGERTEGGSYVPLGQRTSRIRLCLGKSLIGPRILLMRSVVLSYGPSHGLLPVLATEPAHRVPLGKWRLPGQDACREYVVEFQLESHRDPGV